jgi:hypothetical protein
MMLLTGTPAFDGAFVSERAGFVSHG